MKIYTTICDKYEKDLKYGCERFSNNIQQDLTEQEIITIYKVSQYCWWRRTAILGSCRAGYFVINSCLDVEVSCNSHLENLKGYYKTLENHRKMSEKFSCSTYNFEKHNEFLADE